MSYTQPEASNMRMIDYTMVPQGIASQFDMENTLLLAGSVRM